MNSLNNIEKMMQLATIDQLYVMLQKLQTNNIPINSDESKTNSDESKTNNVVTVTQCNECKNDITQLNKQLYNQIIESQQNQYSLLLSKFVELSDKINNIEQKIDNIKMTPINKPESHLNGLHNEELEHIKLKIEEVEEEEEEDEEVEEEEDEEVEEEEVEEVEEEEEVEEDEEEEVEEEDEEEEVKKEDEEEVKKEEDEEEEDEEEVFEIEIDDITYFATDEDDGILYEVDKDGDIGKQVGVIKDGEPIFI